MTLQYPTAQIGATRVVLGDPHQMLLDTLAPALALQGFPVSAVSSSCAGLIQALRRHRPELCVANTVFGDGEILDAMAAIRSAHPAGKIILLGSDTAPDTLNAALVAGVHGYVDKNRDVSVLIDAMRRALLGEIVVHGSFTPPNPDARVLKGSQAAKSSDARKLAGYLTQREAQCLSLIVEGLNTAGITHRLGISRATARSHVQSMMAKLGVHSRLEAAAFAVQHSLVHVDGSSSKAG
jgi:two-component system, NarL family, nitrate/nitrite response regulator NarL